MLKIDSLLLAWDIIRVRTLYISKPWLIFQCSTYDGFEKQPYVAEAIMFLPLVSFILTHTQYSIRDCLCETRDKYIQRM